MSLVKETVGMLDGLASSTLATDDVSLVVVSGPHIGKELRLDQELVRIGREDWCDLALPEDQWVSKEHCECWLDEKGVRVRDLKSRNGIQIDGVPVFDAYLKEGSRLQVGQSTFQLRSHQQKREISIRYKDPSGNLVGKSRQMRKIFSMIGRIAKRQVSTLLTGETGTGKTSIARAIHQQMGTSQAPFIVVNCGALPAGLIEASLFGHEKGAFTGADKAHLGFFQQANGGTLFLDEIAELPLDLQPKLLDVLERRVVRRLGSEKEHKVDFHLVTATHRNLQKEIEAGRFREDLFFRIAVVELEVPSLRDRREDIPLLVESMLKELHPNEPLFVTNLAIQALEDNLWPGNIRQLRNTLERSITFLDGNTIDVEDLALPKDKSDTNQGARLPRSSGLSDANTPGTSLVTQSMPLFPLTAHEPPVSLKDILVETERVLLAQALEETDLNAPEAAKLLSISESWLYSRIKRFGLTSQRKK